MDRLTAYSARADQPLLALALVFLVAYATPVIRPDLPRGLIAACTAVSWVVWAAFAVDYLTRLMLVSDRRRYITGHVPELLVLLPALRPLRLLRVLSAGHLLLRGSQKSLYLQAAQVIPIAAALLVFLSAVAMLDAERRSPDANITSFGDALWWASTTITTVGYGDRYPVTGTGRLVAVALMVVGIALLGVVTASVASWFIQQAEDMRDDEGRTNAPA